LLNGAVARKNWLESHKFDKNTTCRPHIYLTGIASRIEDKLRRSIVARTNVGYVVFFVFYDFGRPKIADLEFERICVEENVGRFEITMADVIGLSKFKFTAR
jgi:hypothetical protein